jgi:hypothetical protein
MQKLSIHLKQSSSSIHSTPENGGLEHPSTLMVVSDLSFSGENGG